VFGFHPFLPSDPTVHLILSLLWTCSYCGLQFQWPSGLPVSFALRPSLSFPCSLVRAVVCNLYCCCHQECCQCFPHLPFCFLDKQDLVYFSILNLQLWLYNGMKDIDTGVRGVRTMVSLSLCLAATECCLASQLGLLSLLFSSRPLHPWCGVLVDSGETVSISESFFPWALALHRGGMAGVVNTSHVS